MKTNSVLFLLGLALLASCGEKQPASWVFKEEIRPDDIAPLGIAADSNCLWISDPDNNRIVKTSLHGEIIEQYPGFQRPMHIARYESTLYIPEFLTDSVKTLENGNIRPMTLEEPLNAPAGLSVSGEYFAITGFYMHRVLLFHGDSVLTIGRQGHGDGELYYPTDVEIHNKLLYVADAYNNRVQVFNLQGMYVQMIGWNDSIQVATGLAVTDRQVFVADFYGNRVLVYDHAGNLQQTLQGPLDKPTDISIWKHRMYIAGYGAKNIAVYGWQ